jgi:hypothetical protein
MSARIMAFNFLAQLFFAGACVAQGVDPGLPEPVRAGDRWSYEVTDALTGDLKHVATLVVLEVNEKEITARTTLRGTGGPAISVYDADWNRIDEGGWTFRPNDGLGIRKPLQVGKEWRSESNAKHLRSGTVFRTSGVAKVVGQEQVTTPAGTFETFRIEMAVRQVNTNDPTRSASVNYVLWYAPQVNRWIKRTEQVRIEGRLRHSFIDELTEYSRRP